MSRFRTMKNHYEPLKIWLPTGRRHVNIFRTIWHVFSSSIFLMSLAVAAISMMFFCNIINLWVGAIALSAVILAIVSILLNRKEKNKPLVSARQAKKHNAFHYVVPWSENRYTSRINWQLKRTPDDNAISSTIYSKLAEAFVILNLYDDMNETKIKFFTGREFNLIRPIEFHVDFVIKEGLGYVYLSPSVGHNANIEVVNKAVIKRILRELGLIEWDIECIDYDEGVKLFLLSDGDKRYEKIVYNGLC